MSSSERSSTLVVGSLTQTRGGYAQACHGKCAPLSRMRVGDGLVYYSSVERFQSNEKCQKFTALGTVAPTSSSAPAFATPYQALASWISPSALIDVGFQPFRVNVNFDQEANDVAIGPLISTLSFIKNKQKWGGAFRFGFLEIPEADFGLISDHMKGTAKLTPENKSKVLPSDDKAEKKQKVEIKKEWLCRITQPPKSSPSSPQNGRKPQSLSAAMAAARAPSPRPERENKDGGTKLDPINEQFRTACDSANLEDVKRLLKDKRIGINMKDPRGWVSLHDAANAASMASSPHELLNALEIIKILLKTGADPRIATRSENTTFHLLGKVQVQNAKEWEEARKQLKATLQLTFEKGAEINFKNTQGITPLHEAAFRGAAESALFFLQHNADPNLRTLVGETALHYAVRAQKEDCVRMLLSYRADPNLKSEKSSSLELAQELGLENIKKIITDFIANPKYEDLPKVGGGMAGLLTLRNNNRSQQTLPVGLPGEPASPSATNQSTEDIEDVILVKTLADIPRSLLQRLHSAGIPQEAMLEENCEQICRILKTNDKQLDIRYMPQNSDTDLWSKEDPRKLFKEIEVAGKGGFGRVFYAQKLDGSNFRVAIKKMDHVTRRERRRNIDEILALRDYRHSNIVQYISAYKLQKEVWVVMEFMEGGTLEQAINATKFPEDQIAYIMKEILRGLAFLHSKSRAHRDIKSANVMLTTAGNVKLIDLGLSADMSQGPRTDNCGSPFWLPPEMILDKPHTLAVDIWSFGITLIEAANGSPPNRAAALKAVWDVALSPSPSIDGMACDGKPWSAEMKALVKDPAKRATSNQLLDHAWLNRAMSRKDIGRVFQRVFMVKQLDKMGFGF